MKLFLFPFFLMINPFLSTTSIHLEMDFSYGMGNYVLPQFEIIYGQAFPFKSFLIENGLNIDHGKPQIAIQDNSSRYAEGDLRLQISGSTDSTDTLTQFINDNPHLKKLSAAEIYSAVNTFYDVLLNGDAIDIDYVRTRIGDFGKNASREAKILFLQLLAGSTQNVYDNSKLNPTWTWEDRGRRTSTVEMLMTVRDWLLGGNRSAGVCYDTELMVNEFAPLMGLQGAIVIGNNSSGNLHPEGLFFDTSDPGQTLAFLQDWSKMVVIPINTPTQLADALAELTGSHILGRALYDANGHPLKIIHSTSDLITLGYMGHQEAVTTMSELTDGYPEKNVHLPANSSTAVNINYQNLSFEIRDFTNPITEHNLLLTLFYNAQQESGESLLFKHEAALSFLHEYPGVLSSYYQQETNEHAELFIRLCEKLTTERIELIRGWLTYSFYNSIEGIIGYYQHSGSFYKQGVSMPLVEVRAGGNLSVGDRKVTGFEVSFTPFITGNLFMPKDIAESVGSFSNYMNCTLSEFHLLGSTAVMFSNNQYFIFQTDYMYTNIEHQLDFTIGVQDERGLGVELYYKKGFPNSNFPVFHLQDSPVFGGELSWNFKIRQGQVHITSGLNLFFETEPAVKQTKSGVAVYCRL